MLLKERVNTEFGMAQAHTAHCDYCGKKHIVDGAMDWIEVLRLDHSTQPLHFCCIDHLVKGGKRFQDRGIKALDRGSWPLILGVCFTAKEE